MPCFTYVFLALFLESYLGAVCMQRSLKGVPLSSIRKRKKKSVTLCCCYSNKVFLTSFLLPHKCMCPIFQECHTFALPGFAGGILAGLAKRWEAAFSAHRSDFLLELPKFNFLPKPQQLIS